MIRPATINDVPAITELMKLNQFWQDNWRDDVLERAITSTDSLALVWEETDQIHGFVCAHDCAFRGYLSELVVRKSHRGRGIARALLERIQQELAINGCASLIADVWHSAETFYKSLGWSEPDVKLLRKKCR